MTAESKVYLTCLTYQPNDSNACDRQGLTVEWVSVVLACDIFRVSRSTQLVVERESVGLNANYIITDYDPRYRYRTKPLPVKQVKAVFSIALLLGVTRQSVVLALKSF